jgi:hypothetical protein
MLWVCLLKVSAADLIAWNLGGNREHRHTISVAVEEAIDEVKIAWAATPRAYRDLSCQMSLCTSGEGGNLLMPYMQPFNFLALPDDLGQPVQGVAYDPVDSFHSCVYERFDKNLSHIFCHVFS